MSISKVTAAIVGATQETTLTLANINFDFSLIKVEAPAEYQALGECLSKNRRDAAENGNEHIFARKLGALFSTILPSTPNLIKIYGERASEIVREICENEKSTFPKSGIFNEWTGPDATSIWAAATSGSGAIAVHLSACLLARIWTPPEAEAIWDEIIQSRKRELLDVEVSNPMRLAAELAAQIEITRPQISRWDSSARAWLQVADRSKLKQQTQLSLLVDNAGIPIKQASDTYHSVLDAWITSLTTMEKIITGIPQSIIDGSAILALKAWHIYPDMFVLGASPNRVHQHDHLLPPGAMITLGHFSLSPDTEGDVCWSLPLAYLKYYGDPVISTRSIGESTSRLTIQEFFHVIFGCILANWDQYGQEIEKVARFFFEIGDFLERKSRAAAEGCRSWMQLLAETAEAYLSSSEPDRQKIQNLIARGRRRYKNFLTGQGHRSNPLSGRKRLLTEEEHHFKPLFGLNDFFVLLELIPDIEDKIATLRLVAQNTLYTSPDSLIIRHIRKNDSSAHGHYFYEDLENYSMEYLCNDSRSDDIIGHVWEYATALKQENTSNKSKFDLDVNLSGHIRWRANFSSNKTRSRGTDEQEVLIPAEPATKRHAQTFYWSNVIAESALGGTSIQRSKYKCIIGNPIEAAIFKRTDAIIEIQEKHVTEILCTAVRRKWLDRERLIELLDCCGRYQRAEIYPTLHYLRALAAAADVYKLMPGATIATNIFSVSLEKALWVPIALEKGKHPRANTGGAIRPNGKVEVKDSLIYGAATDPRLVCTERPRERRGITLKFTQKNRSDESNCELVTYRLDRSQVFSCIAMFENGNVNLDPGTLRQVLAISAGNSIYVAFNLLSDPFENTQESEVKHIVGNIGKPGISLMIPPTLPKVRKVDEETWTMVNHADFDGNFDNAFQHTSLHLCFTRYQLPVASRHGYQGIETNFIETLVSIFDREEWVADLDILGALQKDSVWKFNVKCDECQHKRHQLVPTFRVTSIDSWNEFLDRPRNACLFRARNNWLARLAATALNIRQGFKTVVLEDTGRTCWGCFHDWVEHYKVYTLSEEESIMLIA